MKLLPYHKYGSVDIYLKEVLGYNYFINQHSEIIPIEQLMYYLRFNFGKFQQDCQYWVSKSGGVAALNVETISKFRVIIPIKKRIYET